jgi:predicted Zn-dependent protease
VQRQLAQLYLRQGDRPRAVETYERVVEAAPADAVALNNLAGLLLEQSPDEALGYARRASAAAPGSPAIADTLGMARLRSGDVQGALGALGRAHAGLRGNPTVTLHYAQALLAAEQQEEARRLLLELADQSFDGSEEVRRLLDGLN